MSPEIFELFGRPIRWYGLMMAVTMLAAIWIADRLLVSRNLDGELIWEGALWMIAAGIFGARAVYVVTSWSEFGAAFADPATSTAQDLYYLIAFWNGGISIHGSLIFGGIAGYFFFRNRHVSFFQMCDAVAPGVALGVILVRIGNYMNGDITGFKVTKIGWSELGKFDFPTHIPWALSFPYDEWHRAQGALGDPSVVIPRHPTELYGLAVGLVVFPLMLWLYRKELYDGVCFFGFMISYSLVRSVIEEPFRAVHWHWPATDSSLRESMAWFFGGPGHGYQLFTMTQLVSILFIAIGVYFAWRSRKLFLEKREEYQEKGVPYSLYVAYENGVELSRQLKKELGAPVHTEPPVEWEMGEAYADAGDESDAESNSEDGG